MNNIFFYSADKAANLKNKTNVRKSLLHLFENEKVAVDRVNYIFCSDEYLVEINRQYLNHDTLTDVITFPFSKKLEPLMGEVYLSVERIKENAKAYNVTYETELLRVIIHGALHLCGYTDKGNKQKDIMNEKEDFYLNQIVPRETNN